MVYEIKNTNNELIAIVAQAESLPRVGDYIALEKEPENMYRVLGVKHFIETKGAGNDKLKITYATRPVVCVTQNFEKSTGVTPTQLMTKS